MARAPIEGVRLTSNPWPENPNALLEGLQANQSEAWGDLYQNMWPRLEIFARTLKGRPDISDELAHLALCNMYSAVRRGSAVFDNIQSLKGYLYKTLNHLLIDEAKREARDPWSLEELVGRSPSAKLGKDDEWSGFLTFEDYRLDPMILDLQEVFQSLTEDQLDVLTAIFIEGLSIAETAKVLSKTEGAIKSLQHRGLAALGRALE